jgi:hypothetical protein
LSAGKESAGSLEAALITCGTNNQAMFRRGTPPQSNQIIRFHQIEFILIFNPEKKINWMVRKTRQETATDREITPPR